MENVWWGDGIAAKAAFLIILLGYSVLSYGWLRLCFENDVSDAVTLITCSDVLYSCTRKSD